MRLDCQILLKSSPLSLLAGSAPDPWQPLAEPRGSEEPWLKITVIHRLGVMAQKAEKILPKILNE